MQPSRHMQPCWVLLLVIACCAASPASAASIHQAGKKNDALAMGHTVSPQPQLQHPPLPMRSSGGSGKGGTDSSSKRSKGSGAGGSGNGGGSSPASKAPLRARLQAIPAQQVSSLPRTQIGLITVIGEVRLCWLRTRHVPLHAAHAVNKGRTLPPAPCTHSILLPIQCPFFDSGCTLVFAVHSATLVPTSCGACCAPTWPTQSM